MCTINFYLLTYLLRGHRLIIRLPADTPAAFTFITITLLLRPVGLLVYGLLTLCAIISFYTYGQDGRPTCLAAVAGLIYNCRHITGSEFGD